MSNRPVIGISMGDPSGIGPEIILKALSDSSIYEFCKPLVFGDPGCLTMDLNRPKGLFIKEISTPDKALGVPGNIDLIACSRLKRDSMLPGKPSREGGIAMVGYIIKAVEKAISDEISAIVTCPINKSLMNSAGYTFEGHTQLISHLTGSKDYTMMLAGERLRVTLVTIHCALKDVPANIDENRIFKTITGTSNALKEDFNIKNPRIAVAALNPHGGEEGLFGSEEKEIILPAVKRALKAGYNVTGPLPSDTLYFKAVSGEFDAVVNMYHDQGLIPLKLLHFSDAVNVTLGLPIVRTSVDHGTAYDIAGKGLAKPDSLKAAIKMAANIVKNRKTARDKD
jgi:4-hydroxythreonine-4-phosphate dehydrogenase